ncbi:hypothetical protein GGR54DRAFT_497608 [Hypoxylon sp. NC1633]|nr:hypothetical protein GGR54DRAFT_497608 [Hypoxylon sp. NC1633]
MVETPRYTPGGFLRDGNMSLPSPALSTASSRAAARLPHPRSKPLVRGSKKEDYARNYVSERLMHISRRYVKKHGIPDPTDEVTGYECMDEVCKDIEEVVDVLWFSGTPSLQIPYLLNVALAFNTYLPSFPPSPRATFALLKKLDHCFASLVVGRDVKSKDPLPGFQGTGRGLTRTDMVRCKSLADETRMLVAMVMNDEPDVENLTADNDDITAERMPARRNVNVSLSTGFIQSPVPDSTATSGSIGASEQQDTDHIINIESGSDLSNMGGPGSPGVKRQPDDMDLEDEAHDDKRMKVEEDDEESGPRFSDAALGNGSPSIAVDRRVLGGPGEKFHWMVDDDDDSDNESALNSVTNEAAALSTVQIAPDTEREMGGPSEELDEEEEELQLNVGKVYERTLVQLGRSLGESIIDDP